MSTLWHGPRCNLGEWWGIPHRCALLGGFAIGARVALLWQHNVNPSYKRVPIPRYDYIVRMLGGVCACCWMVTGSNWTLNQRNTARVTLYCTWRPSGLATGLCGQSMGDHIRRINHLSISSSHPGQLSLLPSEGWEMSTSQSVVMLCGWGVKAGMVHSICG